MYIFLILEFLFTCFLSVFFFIQLKEKEEDIEELYNLYYENLNKEKNQKINDNKKGRVFRFDKYGF